MSTEQAFVIGNKEIEPGQNEIIRLQVARLPSGTRIHIHVHVYRSENPGPTLLVLGGVHGDEINGVEIVRRSISSGIFDKLEKGNIIAIPLLNIYGFINFSRDTPDGKDVNRSFPGTMSGSLSSRVARTLTKKIMPLVDLGVDFHTGGGSRYNYPQIRYAKGSEKAFELAKDFGAPYMINKPIIPKSLRKVGANMDIPIIVFEGGESLRFDGFSIEKGLQGLRRLMNKQSMTSESIPNERQFIFNKSKWLRASRSGLFTWSKQSGHKVHKGEPLGVINDPYGQDEIPVLSTLDGYIIGHNNACVVSEGDALFHIAYDVKIID